MAGTLLPVAGTAVAVSGTPIRMPRASLSRWRPSCFRVRTSVADGSTGMIRSLLSFQQCRHPLKHRQHPITWSMLRQHTLLTLFASFHHTGEDTPRCSRIAAGVPSRFLEFTVFFSGCSSLFHPHRLSSSLGSDTFNGRSGGQAMHSLYQQQFLRRRRDFSMSRPT